MIWLWEDQYSEERGWFCRTSTENYDSVWFILMKGNERKGGEMKKETDVSRRNFLKGTVMGAGALTAGFGAGLITRPRIAHAALGYLPYTSLDLDEVRMNAWKHYHNSGG
jgi:hypothetical protein